MEKKQIQCSLHGKQEIGLLCTHLAHSLLDQTKVGFHEYDEADLGRPDAWCNDCNAKLKEVITGKDKEQWFVNCDYKILCVCCWDEAKNLNQLL